MITVACFFWRDPHRVRAYTYNHGHVRTLQAMAKRHLAMPHRFVCITDEEIPGVETVPVDWTKHVPGTCGVKLMLWRPDIGKVLGDRIFYLDLDVVITGTLDPLVDRPEDVVLWHNPNFPLPRRAFFQTSVQLLTAGARPHLWHDFDPMTTPVWHNGQAYIGHRFGGFEQAWLSERLDWDAEAYWDHRDGIYGAGRLVNGQMGQGVQSVLPDNARIVSFPGNREPSQPGVQAMHPWVKEHYRV